MHAWLRTDLPRLALAALAAAAPMALHPAMAMAQDEPCSSCATGQGETRVESRADTVLVARLRQQIADVRRQLEDQDMLERDDIVALRNKLQRLTRQLSRAQAKEAESRARGFAYGYGTRDKQSTVAPTPPAVSWSGQRSSGDGYLGVNWLASGQLVSRGKSDERWVFSEHPQVVAVEPASPAERAGIAAGDVILAFDGRDLTGGEIAIKQLLKPGNTIEVKLRRRGQVRTVDVRVGTRPSPTVVVDDHGMYVAPPRVVRTPEPAEPPRRPAATRPTQTEVLEPEAVTPQPPLMAMTSGTALLGAELLTLDEGLGATVGVDRGLLVTRVAPRTPAHRAGLRSGDVVIAAAGSEIASPLPLINLVERSHGRGESVELEIVRTSQEDGKKERRKVTIRW